MKIFLHMTLLNWTVINLLSLVSKKMCFNSQLTLCSEKDFKLLTLIPLKVSSWMPLKSVLIFRSHFLMTLLTRDLPRVIQSLCSLTHNSPQLNQGKSLLQQLWMFLYSMMKCLDSSVPIWIELTLWLKITMHSEAFLHSWGRVKE